MKDNHGAAPSNRGEDWSGAMNGDQAHSAVPTERARGDDPGAGDERFERAVRDALLRRSPGEAPVSLRANVRAIPDADAGRPRRSIGRLGMRLVAALAAAAVVVVAAGILVATRPPAETGTVPVASSRPSASTLIPSPTPSSPTPGPSVEPTPYEPAGPPFVFVGGQWGTLDWSARSTFPDPSGPEDLVFFFDQVYATGQVQVGSSTETAFWSSVDGLSWTELRSGDPAFAGAGPLTLVATTSGLVAWGQDGEPACSAPGAGKTCGPVPQAIWTSPDGVSWTRAVGPADLSGATISSIATAPSGLVAVGQTASGRAAVWTSASGARWQRESLGALFTDAHLYSVRAAGPGFVIGGGTGSQQVSVTGGPASTVPVTAATWWSADGRSWTKGTVERSAAGGAYVSGIFVGEDGLVAVGSASGGKEGTAWTSTDGQTWTPIAAAVGGPGSPPPGGSVLPSYTIADDGVHLIATSYGDRDAVVWWSSTDGRNWQRLAESGATGTSPVFQGDAAQADRWMSRSIVVPDGVLVIGASAGDPPLTRVWRATASASTAVASPSQPVSAPVCTTGQLRISTVETGAAAGTVGGWLRFVNVGSAACSMRGWPTVVAITASGSETRAKDAPAVLDSPPLQAAPTVTLDPGLDAFAAFAGGDNPAGPASTCPPPYSTLRVTPPSASGSTTVSAWLAGLGANLPACVSIEVTMVLPRSLVPFVPLTP